MLTDSLPHLSAKSSSQPKLVFHAGDWVRLRTGQATLCEVLGAEDDDRIRVRGLDWPSGYSAIVLAAEIYLVSRVDAGEQR